MALFGVSVAARKGCPFRNHDRFCGADYDHDNGYYDRGYCEGPEDLSGADVFFEEEKQNACRDAIPTHIP
jgi:hypothetical protein